MLPASDAAAPARPRTTIHRTEGAAGRDLPPPVTAGSGSDGPLDRLPSAADAGGQIVRDCYARCRGPLDAQWLGYDHADFRRRLAGWMATAAASPAEAPAEPEDARTGMQVGEDLRSAIAAALAIGLAHSAEMLMLALSNHPLVRLSAVSHPYVLGTWLESFFKRLADVRDPDPQNRTGIRFEEKVIAAIANWNHVQPALDTVLKSPLGRTLKIVVTAGISAVRDGVERSTTRMHLAALDPDAPPGPRKLTDAETFFVNCLLCWLRNVGVDFARQVVKSPTAEPLPRARRLAERFLRPLVIGPAVPGGVPAMAISTQEALAGALRDADEQMPPPARTPAALAYARDNPF